MRPVLAEGVLTRRWVLALIVLSLVLSASGTAAAKAPVAVGKVVAPGVFGVPFASTSNLTFPSTPASVEPLADGALVYDTSLSVEIVNAGSVPVVLAVSVEEWTPGTVTVTENESGPNGTYRLVPVQVPARLDPSWANGTVSAEPDSTGIATVALPFSGHARPLQLQVGSAAWLLVVLTPSTSSVAGIYTTEGLIGFGLIESGVTVAAMLVALAAARKLARLARRTPRVPIAWPILWIGLPLAAFLFDYVPTNQLLGGTSPLLIPVPVAVAVFPYLPRLWREFEWARVQGIDVLNPEEGTSSEVVLPLVKTAGGLRCAPETWREVFYTLLGVPLPEVRGETVNMLGHVVQVQPRGMAASNPLGSYYQSEVDRAYWYDAKAKIQRVRHRLCWTREVTVRRPPRSDTGLAGSLVKKRRISPHVEQGYLRARFPPLRPVAEELAGVRAAETEAHDNETDRLLVAEMMGSIHHRAREAANRSLAVAEEAYEARSSPRSREEMKRLVEGNSKNQPESEAEAPEPES